MFKPLKHLIEKACDDLTKLSKNVNLKNGFFVFGSSMGGLVARGIVEECELGKYVKALVTVGTP